MSSSQPKGMSKRNREPGSGFLPCPECGQAAMRRVKGVCHLLDGVVVANLERWQCSSCGEDFFDPAAMDRIAAARKAQKSPRRSIKQTPEHANA